MGLVGLFGLLGRAGRELFGYELDLPSGVDEGQLDFGVSQQVLKCVPALPKVLAELETVGRHGLIGDGLAGPLVRVPFWRDLGPALEKFLPMGFMKLCFGVPLPPP